MYNSNEKGNIMKKITSDIYTQNRKQILNLRTFLLGLRKTIQFIIH